MTNPSPRKHEYMGFDDDSVVSSTRTNRPKRYAAVAGQQDRVRFMTNPIRVFGASVQPKDPTKKGFFAYSLADPDDAMKAINGDEEAYRRCEKACPLFRRNYPVVERFAVLLVHVSATQNNRTKKVMQPFPWVFAGDKYVALRDIAKNLPVVPKTGKPLPLTHCEMIVNCSDSNWQKITFMPVYGKGSMHSNFAECKELVADLFDVPGDLSSSCALVEECVAPEPYKQLERSLDRAEGDAGDTEDEFVADEQAKPKTSGSRPAGGGRKPTKPDPIDPDEADEFDVDAGLEDPEPAPLAAKGKPGRKPPPVKPSAPAAEDDVEALLADGEDDIPF